MPSGTRQAAMPCTRFLPAGPIGTQVRGGTAVFAELPSTPPNYMLLLAAGCQAFA